MGIRFVLLVNKQGQTRLAQYYEYLTLDERRALEGEIVRKCLARTEQQCSFVEHRNYKVVYRRYASLFFLVGVDNDENELAILEFIHLLVETMDRHFGNVCELDIMFHLEKAHFMLEEMVMNGCIVETSKMLDKKEAEKTEAELLRVFDYAWNKVGIGACRHDEILSKLASKAKATTLVHIVRSKFQPWKHPMFSQKEGINIDSSVPIDEQIGLLPQIYKFCKSQPRFVHVNDAISEHEICGVALGDGSVCRERPSFGKKRCEKHKGKKILGTSSVGQETTTTCGVVEEDGSLCIEIPTPGRKRCDLHKGRRIAKPELCIKPNILEMGGPLKCLPQPVEDVFEKVTGTRLDLGGSNEDASICGVIRDGHVCRAKPVIGRKRCEEHKGRRITGIDYVSEEDKLSICGAGLGDGSRCRKPPVPGRKRCAGLRLIPRNRGITIADEKN